MDKIIFAVGGTGGHIFPAEALAKKLSSQDVMPIFAGKGLKDTPYLSQEFENVYDIDSAELRFKNPIKILKAIFHYLQGTKQAFKLLKKTKPKLVVGFGSFHSFPVILAAFLKKIPYVLYENNSVLGKINRLFAKNACFCAYELFDLEKKKFGRFVKVYSPSRHSVLESGNKASARKHYGLKEDVFTLLVFGGSQGALSVNLAFLKTLETLKDLKLQVIHLIGKNTRIDKVKKTYEDLQITACVKEFEENMPLAYMASDVMLARSGALSIFEQITFELPAIYIPLPWAADNHQLKNARFIQNKLDAAIILQQKDFSAENLFNVLKRIIENPEQTKEMQNRLKSFKKENESQNLQTLLEKFLSKGNAQ